MAGGSAELVGLFDSFSTNDSLNTICKQRGEYLLRHWKHIMASGRRVRASVFTLSITSAVQLSLHNHAVEWDLSVMPTAEMSKTLLSWGWRWGDSGALSIRGRQPTTPKKDGVISERSPGFFPGAPDPRVLSSLEPSWMGSHQGRSWSCLGQNESRTTIISLSICLFQTGRKKEALRNWSSNHNAGASHPCLGTGEQGKVKRASIRGWSSDMSEKFSGLLRRWRLLPGSSLSLYPPASIQSRVFVYTLELSVMMEMVHTSAVVCGGH